MGDKKSFWRRLFSRKPEESRTSTDSDRFARFERFEKPSSPASAAREVRRCTGTFIQSALTQRRFETVAFALYADGKVTDTERLGDEALRAGKYGQAIRIYTRLGHDEKIAVANDLAAQDGLKRGTSRKIIAGHLYAALQAYKRLLARPRKDHLTIMRKMLTLGENLVGVLEESGDHLAVADTCLYCAQLCVHLAASGQNHEVYAEDPEFYEGVQTKAREYANRARESYRQYVESKNLSPEQPEGRKIVQKLQTIQKILDRISDHARPAP